MVNPELLNFIREAKRRGYTAEQIHEALLSNGWTEETLKRAFEMIKLEYSTKHSVSIWLDDEVLKRLEKRAKRNMLSLPEQIEDILRRSVINAKGKTQGNEKLDDVLVGLFSRKRKK